MVNGLSWNPHTLDIYNICKCKCIYISLKLHNGKRAFNSGGFIALIGWLFSEHKWIKKKIVFETLSNGDIHTCTYMQKNILEYNQKLQDYKKRTM